MLIIITTIFTVEMYTTLYSITLTIWGDSECFVQPTVWVRSLSTVVQRSLQYIWWVYPIIYLFWPTEARCLCCKKQKNQNSSVESSSVMRKSTTMSINNPNDDYNDDMSDCASPIQADDKVQTFITPHESHKVLDTQNQQFLLQT